MKREEEGRNRAQEHKITNVHKTRDKKGEGCMMNDSEEENKERWGSTEHTKNDMGREGVNRQGVLFVKNHEYIKAE